LKTFSDLGISESFVQALHDLNIKTPTEIQLKAIPFLMETGTDFIGQAQTGTGKTAAFGLPVLNAINPDKNIPQALILTPTRELCQQVAKQLFRFTRFSTHKIFVESIYGGAKIDDQISNLRRPTHIVVATPGRLIDLLERKAIDLSAVKTIVLDEADEMLSMGFKKELDAILEFTKGRRHIWLFSATMPAEIQAIIKNYMSPDAMRVQVNKHDVINRDIEHKFVVCNNGGKTDMLFHFLKSQGRSRGVIFCRTKIAARDLAQQLIDGKYNSEALHGDLQQKERDKVMRAFKNKKLQILVATDLAARGLDVEELAYVVHYQLPEKTEYYTHRSGRTARAGRKGFSLSIISHSERPELQAIERELGIQIKEAR
jgi:ATP-dependent RNA helicase DeaD